METCAFHSNEEAEDTCIECGRYVGGICKRKRFVKVFCPLCYLEREITTNTDRIYPIIGISIILLDIMLIGDMYGEAVRFIVLLGIIPLFFVPLINKGRNQRFREQINHYLTLEKAKESKPTQNDPDIPNDHKLYRYIIVGSKKIKILHCCYQSARYAESICSCGRAVQKKIVNALNHTNMQSS